MNNEEIIELIENKEFPRVKELLASLNQVDIAEIISDLDKANQLIVFRMLNKDEAADVFAYLEPWVQENIIRALTDSEIAHIIDDLFLDDAVDFIEEMPAVVVSRVLKNADPQTRNQINHFLQYDSECAGSIMTNEFVDLKQSITVEEAFDVIRKKAFDKETIYTCYVKDDTRKLVGVVTVKKLLLAQKDTLISELMQTNVICAATSDDKESLGSLFTKYGLLAVPVVDSEKRLVGIVTFDDALTLIQEETTEDIEKMAALKPSAKPYLQTGVLRLAINRITWLFVLMVSAMLTGLIIEGFQSAISVLPILVGFIPMLMDTGGNCGAQSSTLTIRGMAVGEIKKKDMPRVLWKELRVGLIIGIALGIFVIARIIVFNDSTIVVNGQESSIINLALAVAIALVCTVILAKILGGLLPMTAKALNLDPALMAAPLITTIADVLSLFTYFGLLKLFIPGL